MSKIKAIAESTRHYGGINLAQRMEECHTSAVSIALVENYEICEAFAFGLKRRGAPGRATPDTLFQAASMSKPVFAAAVMRLAQQGTVDLDADIALYLEDFQLPTYDGRHHTITLRQILSHYGGLNLHGFTGYRHGRKLPVMYETLMGFPPVNHGKLRLIAAPGTAFRYSGGGYTLAEKIITDVCRQDFSTLMHRLVLEPLGMSHCTFAQPLPRERMKDIAVGYDMYNLQALGGFNTMPQLAAAGLWATPSDLARFGIEIMKAAQKGTPNFDHSAGKAMTTPVQENAPYGVGFAVGTCAKGTTFGHGGSNVGYHGNMVFCPQNGSGIVVMQNADIGDEIPGEVTSAFKELLGW